MFFNITDAEKWSSLRHHQEEKEEEQEELCNFLKVGTVRNKYVIVFCKDLSIQSLEY